MRPCARACARADGKQAVQEGNVSSSAASNELPSMLLDAVDGFFMIVNGEGVVEGVTPNVDKYIGVKQVRQLPYQHRVAICKLMCVQHAFECVCRRTCRTIRYRVARGSARVF